jgi:hypothetical protein
MEIKEKMILNQTRRDQSSLWITLLCLGGILALCIGCGQVIQPLSLSDIRLPAKAKQRIADAEDALIITQSQLADTQLSLDRAQKRQLRFNTKPPKLGSATGAAQAMIDYRVALLGGQEVYHQSDLELSRARLQLIYAQTAMRYDLNVYDLKPLTDRVKGLQSQMLKSRSQYRNSLIQWEKRLDQWWSAYRTLGQQGKTIPFWIYSFLSDYQTEGK